MVISIIQILIFVSYITFIVSKFGVLSSISESWYRLEDYKKNLGILFTFFCWGIGFLMPFHTVGDTGWFVGSGAGLVFVGAATMFKSTAAHTNIVHMVGAAMCIIMGFLGIGFQYHQWYPLIMFVVSSIPLYLFVKKNRTWWIEILAFVSIGVGLILIS